jgi:hypothetical protein
VSDTAANPLRAPREVRRRWLVAGTLLVPLSVWALWPDAARHPAVATLPAAAKPQTSQPMPVRPPLRIAAFDAPLWTLDPPPAVPPAPPTLLRLQLVGMVREGNTLKAVIYNQETDELVVVAPGERVGARGHYEDRS